MWDLISWDFWNICISWQPPWSSFYSVLVSPFNEQSILSFTQLLIPLNKKLLFIGSIQPAVGGVYSGSLILEEYSVKESAVCCSTNSLSFS